MCLGILERKNFDVVECSLFFFAEVFEDHVCDVFNHFSLFFDLNDHILDVLFEFLMAFVHRCDFVELMVIFADDAIAA